MAAGSFTQEQIRHFRQVFSQHSDAESGGVTSQRFLDAIQACLEQCSLSTHPPPDYLNSEFNRLGTTGAVTWQQFFQVLIHINLEYGAHLSHEVSPPDYSAHPIAPGPEQRSTFSRTLIRGIGRAVGDFFGVTEASQHGTADSLGWEQVSGIRAADGGVGMGPTLARRPSRRAHFASDAPPDYPGPPVGHSFNPQELSDSDEEDEDVFISAAPPDYRDVVQQPPASVAVSAPSNLPQSGVTRVSVYEGGNDVGPEPYGIPLITQQPQQNIAPRQPPEQWRSQPQPTAVPVQQPRGDLIYNKDEAWNYYQQFVKAEKRIRQRRQHENAVEFFGRDGGEGTPHLGGGGTIRRDRLQSIDRPEDRNRHKKKKKKKMTKLERQSTLVRSKVESLPSFWPVFIVLITIAQVIGMIVLLAIRGLAPIGVAPVANTTAFPSLNGTNGTENVTFYRSVNLWIGPSPRDLIEYGAKFTPCMRTDFGIRRRISRFRDMFENRLGCCKNEQHVGTTARSACIVSHNNGFLSENATFEPNIHCSNNISQLGPAGPFHPCCISITGHCQVMHIDECTAREGIFHPNDDNCDDVNCLRDICGFNEVFIGEDGAPWRPTANQFWRWFMSIFIHLGIIHTAIVVVIQLYVGIKIERTIGWLRVALIYLISGVGGNILSAIFIPYEVNAGASAAVFGLLGVLFVELFQFWQIVDNAWFELLKLTAFVLFLLMLGTLPYVDNMAHVGGLLFGVVSAIIFVPYITFGTWDACRKRILLIICLPLLIALFVAGFVTFYVIRDPNFCRWCGYINCVPYSSDICPNEYNNESATIFSL